MANPKRRGKLFLLRESGTVVPLHKCPFSSSALHTTAFPRLFPLASCFQVQPGLDCPPGPRISLPIQRPPRTVRKYVPGRRLSPGHRPMMSGSSDVRLSSVDSLGVHSSPAWGGVFPPAPVLRLSAGGGRLRVPKGTIWGLSPGPPGRQVSCAVTAEPNDLVSV